MKTSFFSFLVVVLLFASCTTQITSSTHEKAPTSPPPITPSSPLPVILPSTTGKIVEINLIARKFSFEPSEIRVHKGDHVKIHVKSIDVPHGLAIPGYDINIGLPPNEEKLADFVADKAGTFDFECSVYCGSGHGNMEGKLIVD